MAMLYPPYLEGTIPAQVGDTLRIPYQLNRAQGPADLRDVTIHARIKTVSTNRAVFDSELETNFINSTNDIYYANFDLPKELVVGQYYKIQLGFSSKGNPAAYYSTVGVFKYTVEPRVQILNFDNIQTNGGAFSHIGQYESLDVNEKVKEYKFDIWNNAGLFYSTGWQIHNNKNDSSSTVSQDEVVLTKFINDQRYWVQYSIKTINGLEVSSEKYSFYYSHLNNESVQDYGFIFSAEHNREEGSVSLVLSALEQSLTFIQGKFQIIRKEDIDNYWTTVGPVLIDVSITDNEKLNIFTDYSVEQGKTYEYGIFQQNDQHASVVGPILKSKPINVDFEDIYLFDGERQLKIKYNPKISSFKTTTLESKLDTIGGKYPRFFRNGNIGYKEIPLSGLISYYMDDNESFMNGVFHQHIRESTPAETNYSGFDPAEEMRKEREFKLQVLDWLNNGKPKLLRTGPEGNYIVRLMDISLSPNDTLGRRLHTFSGTAYEIDEYTLDNLKKYNFMSQNYKKMEKLYFRTIPLEAGQKDIAPSIYGRIVDAISGSKFKLTFQNYEEVEITIGASGAYNIYIEQENPLIKLEVLDENNTQGRLEYGFQQPPSYPIYDKNGEEIISYKKLLEINQVVNGLDSPLFDLMFCNIYRKNIVKIDKRNDEYFYHSTSSKVQHFFSTALYYEPKDQIYYYYDDQDGLVKVDFTNLFQVKFSSSQVQYAENNYNSVTVLSKTEYDEGDLQDVVIEEIGQGVIVEYIRYKDVIEKRG